MEEDARFARRFGPGFVALAQVSRPAAFHYIRADHITSIHPVGEDGEVSNSSRVDTLDGQQFHVLATVGQILPLLGKEVTWP